MRVLHVVEPSGGEAGVLACRAAIAIAGFDHEVWLLGDSAWGRVATELGVRAVLRIAPPLSRVAMATRAVRRAAAAARIRHGAAPDLVQCWGDGAFGLATAAWPDSPRIVAATKPPSEAGRGELLARLRPDVVMTGLGGAVQATWECAFAGLGGGGVRRLPLPLAPASTPGRREGERSPLAVDGIVLGYLADPADHVGARRFVFAMGLLATLGVRVTAVIPRGTPERRRSIRFLRTHGRRWSLLEIDGPMEPHLGSLDIAVWSGQDGAATLAAAAALRGVPVICPDTPIARDALGELPPECVIADMQPASFCSRALPLAEDATLRNNTAAQQSAGTARRLRMAGEFQGELSLIWADALGISTPVRRPARRELSPIPDGALAS